MAADVVAKIGYVTEANASFFYSSGGTPLRVQTSRRLSMSEIGKLPRMTVGDFISTGASTHLVLEFTVGGLVRLSPSTGGKVTDDRSFEPDEQTVSRQRWNALKEMGWKSLTGIPMVGAMAAQEPIVGALGAGILAGNVAALVLVAGVTISLLAEDARQRQKAGARKPVYDPYQQGVLRYGGSVKG